MPWLLPNVGRGPFGRPPRVDTKPPIPHQFPLSQYGSKPRTDLHRTKMKTAFNQCILAGRHPPLVQHIARHRPQNFRNQNIRNLRARGHNENPGSSYDYLDCPRTGKQNGHTLKHSSRTRRAALWYYPSMAQSGWIAGFFHNSLHRTSPRTIPTRYRPGRRSRRGCRPPGCICPPGWCF